LEEREECQEKRKTRQATHGGKGQTKNETREERRMNAKKEAIVQKRRRTKLEGFGRGRVEIGVDDRRG
jgi:hypothetical protein